LDELKRQQQAGHAAEDAEDVEPYGILPITTSAILYRRSWRCEVIFDINDVKYWRSEGCAVIYDPVQSMDYRAEYAIC
jgi:hypothetical protein